MKKENNKKIVLGIVGVVVLVVVFYGGVVYGKNQVPTRGQGAFAFNAQGNTRGNRNGGGFVGGKIISKDANSITVQLMPVGTFGQGGPSTDTGGSKIVFLDSNTKITKSVDGTVDDLAVGTQVSISGAANSDGSINATSVQVRPNIVPPVVK